MASSRRPDCAMTDPGDVRRVIPPEVCPVNPLASCAPQSKRWLNDFPGDFDADASGVAQSTLIARAQTFREGGMGPVRVCARMPEITVDIRRWILGVIAADQPPEYQKSPSALFAIRAVQRHIRPDCHYLRHVRPFMRATLLFVAE